jgi:hypothetical protein
MERHNGRSSVDDLLARGGPRRDAISNRGGGTWHVRRLIVCIQRSMRPWHPQVPSFWPRPSILTGAETFVLIRVHGLSQRLSGLSVDAIRLDAP